MAVLSALKLVTATRTNVVNPVAVRRAKLVSKLQDQLRLVEALQAGRNYIATRLKNVTDAETGERKTIELPKKVRQWFWQNEAGKYMLHIKYGQNVLYLNGKNATAIEVTTADDLASILKSLQTAVMEGELDKAIETACETTSKSFGK